MIISNMAKMKNIKSYHAVKLIKPWEGSPKIVKQLIENRIPKTSTFELPIREAKNRFNKFVDTFNFIVDKVSEQRPPNLSAITDGIFSFTRSPKMQETTSSWLLNELGELGLQLNNYLSQPKNQIQMGLRDYSMEPIIF